MTGVANVRKKKQMNIQKIANKIVRDKKPQHPRNSVYLPKAGILHTVEKRDGPITYR